MPNENKPQNIWQKLMMIQEKVVTFNVSEDSEKVDPKTRKSAYRYTPGWLITETIRKEMDQLKLMLLPKYDIIKSETIEYPVYKLIGSTPMSFTKKEIHFIVRGEFTWKDTETLEEAGPFTVVASGANGTDKSCASALAQAERYFLLKFFHLTTHEGAEEPDAHDSDTIPGLPASVAEPATQRDACNAIPAGQVVMPAQAGYMHQPVYPQPQVRQPMPQMGPQQPASQQVNVYAAPPQYIGPGIPQGGGQGFNENHPLIRQAIERLMNFDKGTVSHQQTLNECVGILSANGIICTDNAFLYNLTEAAQARRENRSPNYK